MGILSTTIKPKAYAKMTRCQARREVREALHSFLLALSPSMNTVVTGVCSGEKTPDTTPMVPR